MKPLQTIELQAVKSIFYILKMVLLLAVKLGGSRG